MAIQNLGIEPIESMLDACDVSKSLETSMETYHYLLCAFLKQNLMIAVGDTPSVLRTINGLDSIFDSIRIKGDNLSRFLQSELDKQ